MRKRVYGLWFMVYRKKTLPRLLVSVLLFTIYYLPITVFADEKLGPNAAGLPQLQEIVVRIINISVALSFIALTVMLVFGGIKYIISGGEAKPLASANSTITWAILGILFLALSWLGLQLLAKFTGIDFIGNFCLGFKPYCALNLR